mmetsp:Transcript_31912/g.43567  ORF Transcript_31912/g.43567 Transcript_31912/m.43567 type:complete len:442 (-) Transcript_31912:1417-2742(-)
MHRGQLGLAGQRQQQSRGRVGHQEGQRPVRGLLQAAVQRQGVLHLPLQLRLCVLLCRGSGLRDLLGLFRWDRDGGRDEGALLSEAGQLLREAQRQGEDPGEGLPAAGRAAPQEGTLVLLAVAGRRGGAILSDELAEVPPLHAGCQRVGLEVALVEPLHQVELGVVSPQQLVRLVRGQAQGAAQAAHVGAELVQQQQRVLVRREAAARMEGAVARLDLVQQLQHLLEVALQLLRLGGLPDALAGLLVVGLVVLLLEAVLLRQVPQLVRHLVVQLLLFGPVLLHEAGQGQEEGHEVVLHLAEAGRLRLQIAHEAVGVMLPLQVQQPRGKVALAVHGLVHECVAVALLLHGLQGGGAGGLVLLGQLAAEEQDAQAATPLLHQLRVRIRAPRGRGRHCAGAVGHVLGAASPGGAGQGGGLGGVGGGLHQGRVAGGAVRGPLLQCL